MANRSQHRKKNPDIRVRAFLPDDMDSVIAIDSRSTGESKPAYWKHKLAIHANHVNNGETAVHGHHLALVAEMEDRVVGFAIGEIRTWEFRQPSIGWITALAVDADFRRYGIGRRLLAEMLEYFRTHQLSTVRTMVEWLDGEMLSFFTTMGFDRGPFIELEKKLNL